MLESHDNFTTAFYEPLCAIPRPRPSSSFTAAQSGEPTNMRVPFRSCPRCARLPQQITPPSGHDRRPLWPARPRCAEARPAKGRTPIARAGNAGREPNTTPPRSRCWRGSSRCAAAPACISAAPTTTALHHLFAEVIDNAMDEAVAGHASFIEVELEDGRLRSASPTTAAACRSTRIPNSRTSRRSKSS